MHYIHCFTHCLRITAKGAYGHVSLTSFSLCCRVLTCLLCPSATPRSNPKASPKGLVHNLLMQFLTLGSSKIEVFETCVFDIVTT